MSSITLIGPLVLCALALVVFGGILAVVVVRRFRSVGSTRGRQQMLDEARAWLDGERSKLVRWTERSIEDIALSWRSTWTEFVVKQVNGQIDSVTQRAPLIAFRALHGPGINALLATTTAHSWEFHQRGNMLAIMCNGEPLGSWQDGALLDTTGAQIGTAQRGQARSISGVPLALDDRWYDVTLNQRVIGAILIQRGMHSNTASGAYTPLIRPASGIDADAERWLVALALADLGYHALHSSTTTM